jgi:hypothetical protein
MSELSAHLTLAYYNRLSQLVISKLSKNLLELSFYDHNYKQVVQCCARPLTLLFEGLL